MSAASSFPPSLALVPEAKRRSPLAEAIEALGRKPLLAAHQAVETAARAILDEYLEACDAADVDASKGRALAQALHNLDCVRTR